MTALAGALTLPKGSHVTCPKCKDLVARAKVDLTPGTVLDTDLFSVTSGQGFRADGRPQCKRCGHFWLIDRAELFRIHTRVGWFPSDAQLTGGLNAAKRT